METEHLWTIHDDLARLRKAKLSQQMTEVFRARFGMNWRIEYPFLATEVRRQKKLEKKTIECWQKRIRQLNRQGFSFKMKHPDKIIEYARQLAKETNPAFSSRDIAKKIDSRFHVSVSHVTVAKWLEA